ncbi:MAG: serine protease [Pirellulaceae bacterium]|nr:serine protease [Pirellulaceae bacterium]
MDAGRNRNSGRTPAARLAPCGAGLLGAAILALLLSGPGIGQAASFSQIVDIVQPKMVKIYGAGGIQGLESYQSGFLISAEGHVLTVWSYVLDTDLVTVILDDGRKYQAELVGADPRLEIAVLKIEAQDLAHFSLNQAVPIQAGDRVLAFSNLYGVATGDEPSSVLHGNVAATTSLSARRGAFETTYRGNVYVLDAMTNNPGAAGGALTDRRGQLAGILGKELRNSLTNTWLNYAVPAAELVPAVDDILAGKVRPRGDDESARKPLDPVTLQALGIVLVPDVLSKTPPFIDRVIRETPADKAGLRADDLILFVNDRIASSCRAVRDELSYIDRIDEFRLTVQRGQELLDVVLHAER